MRASRTLTSAVVVALLLANGCLSAQPGGTADRQCGISWVAGGEVRHSDLQPLLENGISWLVLTPFGWQEDVSSPSMELVTDGDIFWGETDVGLEATTQFAHELGIKVLLKPHIWLTANQGKWRADIEMESESAWQGWFRSYGNFILHYARLAQRLGIEALCVGTELLATSTKRETDWRAIILDVRKVYPGKLTYAANWYQEYENIEFWDSLDFIGIQAYFPLTSRLDPSVEELMEGWQLHLIPIERISRRHNRPVVFTEIGYRSNVNAAIKPWVWPKPSSRPANERDLRTQANCYEAFFQTFWFRPWFAGAYVWKWFPRVDEIRNEPDQGFSPQGKPSERVLAKWYKGKRK